MNSKPKAHRTLRTRTGPMAGALPALLALAPVPATAQQHANDPHAIYEANCARCHQPHARELARQLLAIERGTVTMRSSGAPLEVFLMQHPHGLAPMDAAALVKHFTGMLETGFTYQDKCVACHERASTIARLRLFERDGVIEGRYTYRDISEYLRNHGRLTPMEVETIMRMFHRQLSR